MEDWQFIFCHLCGADAQDPTFQHTTDELREMFNINFVKSEIISCAECNNLIYTVKSFKTRAVQLNEFFTEMQKHDQLDPQTFDEIRLRFGLIATVDDQFDDVVEALDEAFEQQDECYTVEEAKIEIEETVVDNELASDFNCHICQKQFSDLETLDGHCHEAHDAGPQILCTCGEFLDSLASYNVHKQQHDKEIEFTCKECNIAYKTQNAYDKHIKLKHGENVEKNVCKECDREFKDKQMLKIHARSHLPDDQKFKVPCPHCEKKFVTNHCMKIHVMRIHEKAAVFSCNECGKTFVTRSDLNWHLDKHTNERNFECEICNCKFKSRNSLRIHRRRHGNQNKYVCKTCGKNFNSSAALSNHKLVHSEVKRFKCFCGNEYKRLESYKCHLSIHSGERPFSCQWCTRTFVNAANCRKHKLKEHPVEVKEFELIHGKRGVSLAIKEN